MDKRHELLNDIERSQERIQDDISHIGDIIHNKTNIADAIKKHPFQSLAIGTAAGFALAFISTPIGRVVIKSLIGSAVATAGAHYSKKGIDYLQLLKEKKVV
ncbi:MAG: hypothetical protein WCK67_03710 [bacterium]